MNLSYTYKKLYKKSIFIFRRDFRLDDNIGLLECLKKSELTIPIFIFTPEQLDYNKYKSDNCAQFMVESLVDLSKQLTLKNSRLIYLYDSPDIALYKFIKDTPVDAIFMNRDYTPYSVQRDKKIENLCEKYNIAFESYEDILLNPINTIKTGTGKTYTKFTPFYNKSVENKVNVPIKNMHTNYIKKNVKFRTEFTGNINKFYVYNNKIAYRGGRQNGLGIMKNIKNYKNYNTTRNYLSTKTTGLSAYNKFGCLSIREVYYMFVKNLGKDNDLIKQIYWRDFYYNVSYEHHEEMEKHISFKNTHIDWRDIKLLPKWEQGITGFPIVDAAMREMNVTGFMHNRGRLIVSSFLIKILRINWKYGELYFAKKLIDYDRCQNFGNWLWAFGQLDSGGYVRIFNPWRQSEKYDKDCEYIKKWIPEIDTVDSRDIHKWNTSYKQYPNIKYPKPIIDYDKERDKSIKIFKH